MARILVVDDNLEVREFLRKFLEIVGHEVLEAGNGQEGLDEIQGGGIDLVITDLQMPVMDGDEMLMKGNVLRAILASGEFGDLPTDSDKVRVFPRLAGLPLGRCTFVAKPFDLAKLKMLINKLLAA